jgi:hypothetical protein
MTGLRRFRAKRRWVWPAASGALIVTLLAGAAAAATETTTVGSYWRGLLWSISLVTTVGFVGPPPSTGAGASLSVVLMVIGFFLLALVSASLAALFVGEEEEPREARERANEDAILASLDRLEVRLTALEIRIEGLAVTPRPEGG